MAVAQNYSACLLAQEFTFDLMSAYVAKGLASESQQALAQALPDSTSSLRKLTGRYTIAAKDVLAPLVDQRDPDALELMGTLYMGTDGDRNLAADFLYRASVAYLAANHREQAIESLTTIEQIDKDHPLGRRLRAQLYGGSE